MSGCGAAWIDREGKLQDRMEGLVFQLAAGRSEVIWLSVPIGLASFWMNDGGGGIRPPDISLRQDLLALLAHGVMFALG